VHAKFLWGPEGKNHLEDLGIEGRMIQIISKWIFKKWDGGMDGTDLAKVGTGGRCLCIR